MVLGYTFFLSLLGIIILLSLKSWELRRGAKPFSVLRYRLDILMRRKTEDFKSFSRYISWATVRLTLAFLVAKIVDVFNLIWTKWTNSSLFKLVKGKVLPRATGPVSAFLKDVADFKNNTSTDNTNIKEISELKEGKNYKNRKEI